MELPPDAVNDARPGTPSPPLPWLPWWLRWAGPPAAAAFRLALEVRRAAYAGRDGAQAPLPLLSVGNLTVGGTGKTPAAIYLAEGLLRRGLARRPAILMRGYGAAAPGQWNDEAREVSRRLPAAAVFCAPNRLDSCRQAAAAGCDVALLDDGFQHWRLKRDCDVVLVNVLDPFGGGHLLPWGRLREPVEALQRADIVFLTRCDLAPPEVVARVQERLGEIAPRALLCRSRHAPRGLRPLGAREGEVALKSEALRGEKVFAACALAHPEAFYESVRRSGCRLVGQRAFRDHHPYSPRDLSDILAAARAAGAKSIVVTEKDAAKIEALPDFARGSPGLLALGVSFEITQGQE
jgi:tetraacyldisaccharide 4'-kinase